MVHPFKISVKAFNFTERTFMSENKTSIESMTRAEVIKLLPQVIRKALQSYHDFMDKGVNYQDQKNFSDGHKAAKVAIAHIELLVKLAKWADLPDAKDHEKGDASELEGLVDLAVQDVARYYEITEEK